MSLLRDADLIADARVEAETLLDGDPDLVDHPDLAEVVTTLVDEERAEYLEKA